MDQQISIGQPGGFGLGCDATGSLALSELAPFAWRSPLAERLGGATWRSDLAERFGGAVWRSALGGVHFVRSAGDWFRGLGRSGLRDLHRVVR